MNKAVGSADFDEEITKLAERSAKAAVAIYLAMTPAHLQRGVSALQLDEGNQQSAQQGQD